MEFDRIADMKFTTCNPSVMGSAKLSIIIIMLLLLLGCLVKCNLPTVRQR